MHNLGKDHKYIGFIDNEYKFAYDMGFATTMVFYDEKGNKK